MGLPEFVEDFLGDRADVLAKLPFPEETIDIVTGNRGNVDDKTFINFRIVTNRAYD